MNEMLTKLLDEIQTRQQAQRTPKGILVSGDLFRDMKSAGLINKKVCTPSGLPLGPDWQLDLPFYGDIYVHVDPFLDGEPTPYRLPPKP